MEFSIREGKVEDLKAATALDRISFGPDSWGMMDFLYVLSDRNARSFTACSEGRILGFASVSRETTHAYITTIAVQPEFRNRGIGSALLEKCERAFGNLPVVLNVDEENTTAVDFYTRHGYSVIDRTENYYMTGNASLVMLKTGNNANAGKE